MIKNYRVGPNRIYKTLSASMQDNVAIAYLDPQPTKYTTTHALGNFFRCPISIKGCINDPSFNSFLGVGDTNFVGIDSLVFGPTINEITRRPQVFENLYFDEDLSSIVFQSQSRIGEVLHIIFNRCLFVQNSSKTLVILENVSNAIIEFRHCKFNFRNRGDLFYFFKAVPNSNNTINIIKSVLDLDYLEHHIYVNCVRDTSSVYDLFQSRDFVKNPQTGYGPEFGSDLISNNTPKISGYIYKNDQPVIRKISLFNKYGKFYTSLQSSIDGYYEIDLYTYNLQTTYFAMIEGIEDEKSVIIDNLNELKPVFIEL